MLLRRRLFLRPMLFAGGIVAILVAGGAAPIRDAFGATDGPATSAATTPATDRLDALFEQAATSDRSASRLGFRPRLGRHVVHAVLTVERDGKLLTFQVDRGTIGSIDGGRLTISEAGGTSMTVAIDEQTRVRRDGKRIALSDLKAGDEVYVISQVTSGGATPLAVRIAAPTQERPDG
jgi:hypothetical protein